MGLVNLLRFDEDRGAAVSDEEYWNVYFRRKHFCDNLHALVPAEAAGAWDMEIVYGGTGYPALHHEVVRRVRARLAERVERIARHEASPPATVEEMARIAFDELRLAVRRRIDQKLRFFYGVDTDGVNGGTVTRDGETHPLAAGKVADQVRRLASGEKKDALLSQVFEARAVVFGFDAGSGVTAYHLSPDKYICGYVHEGFECIGTGKYASGLSLGRDFRTRTLMMRKQGYPPAEGLLELLASALLAKDHFKEVGGNIHVVLLDRTASQRRREVPDDDARLAGEIVKAHAAGLLGREEAVGLLDGLVFGGRPAGEVEADLFAAAGDEDRLLYVLRGYKLKEIPSLLAGGKKKARGKAAKAKGGGK